MNEDLLKMILDEILELKEGQKRLEEGQSNLITGQKQIERGQLELHTEVKIIKEHVAKIDERINQVEKINKLFNQDLVDKIPK